MTSLKVKELIKQLQCLDGDLEVASLNRDYEYKNIIKEEETFNTYIHRIVDTTVIKDKCILLYE